MSTLIDAARAVMLPGGLPSVAGRPATIDLAPRLIDVLPAIRIQAWNRTGCGGIQFAEAPGLAAYARWRELGAPMTPVGETCGFVWQGYALGIVVAPRDEQDQAEEYPW